MTLTPAIVGLMVFGVVCLAYVACSIWEAVLMWKLRDEIARLKGEAEE